MKVAGVGFAVVGFAMQVWAGTPGFVDQKVGLIFPEKIGNLSYVGTRGYDDSRLGYSVRYRADESHKFDIYIYDLGRTDIPNGPDNEIVKEEARNVSKQLNAMQERGDYDDLRKEGKSITPMSGSYKFIKEHYSFVDVAREAEGKGGKRLSESYVTGYKGHFAKIRFSYDAKDRMIAKKFSSTMIEGLSEIMNKQYSDRETIEASIAVFKAAPGSYAGRYAGREIFQYVSETEGFTISVHGGMFACMTDEDERVQNSELLMMAYFAGALEHVLANQLEKGGDLEGFNFMLDTYVKLKDSGDMETIQQLEDWLGMDREEAFKLATDSAE